MFPGQIFLNNFWMRLQNSHHSCNPFTLSAQPFVSPFWKEKFYNGIFAEDLPIWGDHTLQIIKKNFKWPSVVDQILGVVGCWANEEKKTGVTYREKKDPLWRHLQHLNKMNKQPSRQKLFLSFKYVISIAFLPQDNLLHVQLGKFGHRKKHVWPLDAEVQNAFLDKGNASGCTSGNQ